MNITSVFGSVSFSLEEHEKFLCISSRPEGTFSLQSAHESFTYTQLILLLQLIFNDF